MGAVINTVYTMAVVLCLTMLSLGRECMPAQGWRLPPVVEERTMDTRFKKWWHKGKLKVSFKKPKIK